MIRGRSKPSSIDGASIPYRFANGTESPAFMTAISSASSARIGAVGEVA